MTELELINGCRQGDNTARKELYRIYSQTMLGVCFRYVGDKAISQDLLHDGFIKVFLSFQSFQYRGKGSLKAWLVRIFVNTALEYLRKSMNQKQLPLDDYNEYKEEIEEESMERIPNDVLMQYISELSDGYRAVFNMFAFESMSHSEIGNALGINESTSRSQLSRAKAILMKKIVNYMKRDER